MRVFRTFMVVMGVCAISACHTPPSGPMTWHEIMKRMNRNAGLHMLAEIHAAPQPASAKALLAPAIIALTRGGLYRDAQHLAGMAVNTFPTDPLYHQLLGEAYQAGVAAGDSTSRTQKKMRHEFERAQELRAK